MNKQWLKATLAYRSDLYIVRTPGIINLHMIYEVLRTQLQLQFRSVISLNQM